MKLLRTLFATSALMAFLALSVPVFAQEQQQNDRDRMKPTEISVTGCLSKSEDSDHWTLTDNQSGAKVAVMGAADFTKHANHTVKVTGTPSEDGTTFNVTKIDHVSDTCQNK